MTPDHHTLILELSDAGHAPDAISRAVLAPLTSVYSVLRQHRPHRPRKPRPRTSVVPERIRWLAGRGHAPGRIALMLGVSRAYVYRIVSDCPEYLPEARAEKRRKRDEAIAEKRRKRVEARAEKQRKQVDMREEAVLARRTERVEFNKRNKQIAALIAEGRTYAEVARMFGVSRQRVHKMLTG